MERIIPSTLSSSFVPAINHQRILNPPNKQFAARRSSTISIFCALQLNPRRSAHYHPSIWETKHIESFATPYTYESHAGQLEELKQITRRSLRSTKDPSILLNLIDSMQRLGVAYHFENEIEDAIFHARNFDETGSDTLYMTALKFRVLREHGLPVSPDVFDKFKGQEGIFKDSLSRDVKGLLSLYEASYLGMHGEDVLEEAKSFSIKNLKSILMGIKMDSDLAKQVEQSLEIPLRWRMPRAEARNFIDVYQTEYGTNNNISLLELAMLDYNLVQSAYQQELKELARWWKDLGFKEKLSFARDRLMENYLWAMGIVYEPQFSKCRIGLTKFVCILTAIDDVYDVYGSLDELQSFTNAVSRWDMEAMAELPLYMKICYVAMLNFAGELVYDVLKSHGFDILPYIKQKWLNLCRSYLKEARWFYSGHIPSVEEYLENSRTSVGGPAAMIHAYLLLGSPITKTSLQFLDHASDLIYSSSLITRLWDDLGTSKAESRRGDVAKAIQCYMVQKCVSEEEAKEEIKESISYLWKTLNQEYLSNQSLPKTFVNLCLNMARTSHFIFQRGDGIGTSTGLTKTHLVSLIVKPISITQNGI